MKLGEVNTQIQLTLVMLDVLCTTLIPSFYQIHLNYSNYYHVFTSRTLRSAEFSEDS